MAIWINDELCNFVKKYVKETWSRKRVKTTCKPHSWQSSRYIQISTPIKDMDIHYEITLGRVQFHIEGKFTKDEYKPFLNYLRNEVRSDGDFQWRRRMNMTQGLCEVNYEVEHRDELTKCITQMIDRFDSLIESYVGDNPDLFPNQTVKEEVPPLSYKIQELPVTSTPEPQIKPVGKIEFDKLIVPPYQRPYKWTAKNVNQLITDIITFQNKKQYRLGTLVLYNNEIVDGQQRIITLVLIIKKIFEKIKDDRRKESYKEIIKKVNVFTTSTKFPNRYSLHNVVENIHAIEARESDLDEKFLYFVLNKCEFVVVELTDISEAFQFFDSQNARGKDLEAHDLLKAYHLREILEMKESDSENINKWQCQQTTFLKEVFLTLFRAKRWSQGKSARYFTKNKIGVFKGISLKDGKRYPFYQMEIIAHVFSEIYSNDSIRIIDQNKMEYPFNLDNQIINGSRFFDMIRHYMNLYRTIQKKESYNENGSAFAILDCISNYEGESRTGDQYIKSMFFTLLLYYVDRFGMEEMDKVIPKFFIWAYKLRLESPAVQLASIDNYSKDYSSMLRHVHNAQTPYDIINLSQDGVTMNAISCTKCEKIIDMFKKFNKIYNND